MKNRLLDSMRRYRVIKRTKNNFNDCALEVLNDDILVHILSFLPLKDAIATSTLSYRWRYLWRYSKMSLNFDAHEQLLKNHSFEFANSDTIINYLDNKRETFMDPVNSVVNQHVGEIDSFRVCYYLSHDQSFSVDKWIKFAMRSRTLQTLELDFSVFCGMPNCYRFSSKLFSDNDLYFGSKSLKELSLDSVCVSGKDIKYLLCNAPVLEKLIVRDSPKLVSLRVSGQSLALESLIITKCEKLKKVEICEVNLVTLYIEGDIETKNFILRDVPKLVHLSVHFNKCDSNFTQLFSCCLSQLVTLTMVDFTRGNKYDEDDAYPTLPNLKHLSLSLCIDDEEDGGLGNLRLLIEAFPNLETLVLHAPNYYSDLENRPMVMSGKAPKRPHKFLKEVEIVEYGSEFGDFERMMYLMKNAVALEKIIINCKYDSRPRIEKNIEQLFEEEEIARRHAMSQLQREIPSTIEFVCH